MELLEIYCVDTSLGKEKKIIQQIKLCFCSVHFILCQLFFPWQNNRPHVAAVQVNKMLAKIRFIRIGRNVRYVLGPEKVMTWTHRGFLASTNGEMLQMYLREIPLRTFWERKYLNESIRLLLDMAVKCAARRRHVGE